MGDPNASIPTPQPVYYRPMWGAFVKARSAIVAQLEKQGCPDTARTRCQVVSLYGGGQYKLVGSVRQEGVSDDFIGFLPLYIEFEKGTFVRLGLVSFRGTATVPIDTTIPLSKKPRRVVANAMSDVLTRD